MSLNSYTADCKRGATNPEVRMSGSDQDDQIDDWAAETAESITVRLDGAKTSQAQTRITLAALAVVSIMMLTVSYNAYFSYDYNWILAEKDKAVDEKTAAGVLRVQALKDWASSRIIQVSLLGIRVSVDDAAVLGTLVLFVLSVWLLLVTRRENYTIGFLLRDTDSSIQRRNSETGSRSLKEPGGTYTDEQRWRIFHAILANSLFMTVNPSLSRFKSLRADEGPGQLVKSPVLRRVSYWTFIFARGFFFMFPVVASLVVFGIDRYSYVIPDPFEPHADIPGFELPFFSYSFWMYLVCWIPLCLSCWRAGQYLLATERVLQEYGGKLKRDLRHVPTFNRGA